MSGVWTWIEHHDGQIRPIGQELLGAGRIVADALGEKLTALVFGQDVTVVAQSAFASGAVR